MFDHRNFALFLVCLATVATSGCGKIMDEFGRRSEPVRQGTTRVAFSPGRSDPRADTLVGGVMIYAVSSSSGVATEGFYFSSESAATSGASLPNGTYQFYAFGYDGAIDGSPVHVECGGNGSTVTLNGSAVTVPITLSYSNCSDTNFSDGGTTYNSSFGVVQLQFYKCYSGSYSGTMTNGMSTSPCGSNSGSPVSSAKLFLNSYTNLSDTSTWQTAISSSCYAASPSNFPSTSSPRVPQMASSSFLAVTVITYTDGSCNIPKNTYTFSQGVEGSSSSSGNTAYSSSSPGLLLLRDF